MKSIVIIIDYFGRFPYYFPFFLESCKMNPTINWIIHSDCEYTPELPKNVEIKYISWDDYKQKVCNRLHISFFPRTTYKICDLKPAFGCLWKEEIQQYDFWGFGDIDLVYGDIRSFYTDELLENYDILSVAGWGISGPFCLLKNEPWAVNAFCRVPGWKDFFSIIDCVRFDEDFFYRAFFGPDDKFYERIYLKEQYITPLCDDLLYKNPEIIYDDTWYWKNGKITSPANGNREFICLHFMNYISARFMSARYGTNAPWSKLDTIVNMDLADISDGFKINMDGFSKI